MGLLGEGAVVGLQDELQLGQRLLSRPELEPVPLDDAALLGVKDLGVDLLLAELGPLVLHDLLAEVVRQVVDVGVGRGGRQVDIIALPANQLDDQVLGARGGGAYQAGLPVGVHLQAHAEHDLVPRFLQVVPSGQLVGPAPVELWPPEALRLRRWDALDQRAVDQLQLVHLLVVVSDQDLGDDGQEPGVTLKAGGPDVSACGGGDQPPGPGVLPCPPPDLLGSGAGLPSSPASQQQPDRPPLTVGQHLVVVGLCQPLGPLGEGHLVGVRGNAQGLQDLRVLQGRQQVSHWRSGA